MLKGILFDLDGTLIQTELMIMEGFRHAMHEHLPEVKITKEDETNFLGQTLDKSFNKYSKDEKVLNNLIESYKVYTNEKLVNGLKTHNNAVQILKHLKDNDLKIGVVTSKRTKLATENLAHVGLIEYVDVVVGSDLVKNHKPHPESLELALTKLGLKPENAIYIGDHENDIKAANAAKMMSCGVTYSYRLKELLLENPTYIIDDLINLEDVI